MRLLALAAGALIVAGCARGPSRIHVVSVAVADGAVVPFRDVNIDEGAAAVEARSALAAAGFRIGAGSEPHRAVLVVPSVRVLPPITGEARLRAEVTAEIVLAPAEPSEAPPLRETATSAVPLPPGGAPRDAWLTALRQAAHRAAEGLALAIAAGEKSTRALMADVTARDVRVREQAVRVLGERRAREAVPVLIARLTQEDPRLAHRIVGALAQIGDERAVPALIDVSRGGDSAVVARLARYIGDIGGAEAEAYLLTLASGHPDEPVRKAAQEALDEMTARAKEAAFAQRK